MLTTQWENSEETYIDSCKSVFGEIRRERELIHRYFYGTRLATTLLFIDKQKACSQAIVNEI